MFLGISYTWFPYLLKERLVIRKGQIREEKRTAATGSIFAGLYSWRRDSFPSQPSGARFKRMTKTRVEDYAQSWFLL